MNNYYSHEAPLTTKESRTFNGIYYAVNTVSYEGGEINTTYSCNCSDFKTEGEVKAFISEVF